MKKDIICVVTQFFLFALYFIDWNFYSYQLPSWLSYIALFLVVVGLLVVLFGILSLNVNFSPFPSPRSNASLISHGIYKYMRHPIYSGIIIALLAYALFSFSAFRLFITIGLITVFYFKTKLEEKLLRERFEGYSAYMKRTGRFFPKKSNNNS